jgi:hypothetical protein
MERQNITKMHRKNSSVFVFERCSVRILAETSAILTKVCSDFPQSLHANAGTVPLTGHNHFFANPVRSPIASHHLMLYSLDTEKAPLNNQRKIIKTLFTF